MGIVFGASVIRVVLLFQRKGAGLRGGDTKTLKKLNTLFPALFIYIYSRLKGRNKDLYLTVNIDLLRQAVRMQ